MKNRRAIALNGDKNLRRKDFHHRPIFHRATPKDDRILARVANHSPKRKLALVLGNVHRVYRVNAHWSLQQLLDVFKWHVVTFSGATTLFAETATIGSGAGLTRTP
jgi:hypothetical protein